MTVRILFAASEIYPLAKTGGLADVSAALPQALAALGADVQLIMPGYAEALDAAAHKYTRVGLEDVIGMDSVRVIEARTPDAGLPVWLVDCPRLFRRTGLYQDEHGRDWPDNPQRFAVLNHVAARLATGRLVPDWAADVVHANDWHAGLLPLLVAQMGGKIPASVFTMHNLAYQGLFPAHHYSSLGLPEEAFCPEGIEFYGQISFLKAGIRYADRLTTVSPTYAREILTPDQGRGLENLLKSRASVLSGILNGIDHRVWDPATDPHLARNYTARNLQGKRECKAALQRELGLESSQTTPLVVYLSRLADQKMSEVVVDACPEILDRGLQLAALGRGDPAIESGLRERVQRYPGMAAVRIGYEESLAHQLLAGADILLHPSRFEPCGLTHRYAMRYGTVPIVRRTGGLADTVVDCTQATMRDKTANGLTFEATTAADMLACLDRALALYRQPVAWRQLQRLAMEHHHGWEAAARQYMDIYRGLAPDVDLEQSAAEFDALVEIRA
jgi:starch synthase